ncbi:hypothetical protein D9M68_887260 [compost metagenome]
MLGDHRHVLVVARVGAQLRHALAHIADLELAGLPQTEAKQQHGQQDHRRATLAGGQRAQALPQPIADGFLAFQARRVFGREVHEREQNR